MKKFINTINQNLKKENTRLFFLLFATCFLIKIISFAIILFDTTVKNATTTQYIGLVWFTFLILSWSFLMPLLYEILEENN